MKIVAKTAADGTAASETALCGKHDTPLNRQAMAANADKDVVGPWVDATGNDWLRCQKCGARGKGRGLPAWATRAGEAARWRRKAGKSGPRKRWMDRSR